MINNLAACLHHPTHQIANFFSLHIQQEHISHMLHHMKQLVAETIQIFSLRSTPSNRNHALPYPNIRVSDPLIRIATEHKITGIFERNADAPQISKTPSDLHGIPRPHVIHHMHRPVIPLQVNLLLSHYTLLIIIPHPKEYPHHYGHSPHRSD